MAEEKSLATRAYEKIMGTPEQNKAAEERMAERDAKNPDTIPAKVNKAVKAITGKKAGGKVASASKRADGIAQRGKTKGKVL
jgi:hypothetical protein